MFKAMILLKRKDSVSREEFAEWWLTKHKPLAQGLPGLRRAVFNLVAENPEADAAYDGVSELWFDSQSDFEAAYASDTGKAVAADSMANVGTRERLLVSEHVIKE